LTNFKFNDNRTQFNKLKCKKCRFQGKKRREYCYYYERYILDAVTYCKIDPNNVTIENIKFYNRKKKIIS